MLIILLLLKIKSLLLSFRAKLKPIIIHYYSHKYIQKPLQIYKNHYMVKKQCLFWMSIFSPFCKSASKSNNLNLFFKKISCNFILKLVNMFSLLNTDCRVDLSNFILIPSYSIIADEGLEYICKHQNLTTVNQRLANQPRAIASAVGTSCHTFIIENYEPHWVSSKCISLPS